MPPIRGSSSEDTLLSELGAKITAAFRRARPDHYNGETHPGDWLHHIESLCSSCGITRGAWSRLAVIQLREVIYAEMHLKADRVNTPPTRELENVEDASSHVEASVPHQPEAVGDDDAHIGSEEEDPTEVFSEGEDDETDGP
ncbi:hypothetical protein TIFTF001_045662 [Ficus carica]|uniref:Uncharacterized protein n=1 Tax=Ficus carica TaxID=3494 RepID=A0AA87YSM5_FICCA|nr:hypothetical protein TIFTF001_045662 [Ficus carica]